MKTQIFIAILLFVAPFFISPVVAQAAEKSTYSVSLDDNDKKDNTKTEGCANKSASADAKKECCKSAEKKGCAEAKSSEAKSAECAKKEANCTQFKNECPKSKEKK